MYTPLLSPIHVTCPAHLILLVLNGSNYKPKIAETEEILRNCKIRITYCILLLSIKVSIIKKSKGYLKTSIFVISLYQVMPVVSLTVTEKLTVSQNRSLVKVRESKTTRETRRGIIYNDKVTVYTSRQVLFLVVKSRNTRWGHVLHTEEMRRDVHGSAHVTKSEV